MNEIEKIKKELVWADAKGVSRPDLESLRDLIAYVEAAELLTIADTHIISDTNENPCLRCVAQKLFVAARAKLGLK